MIRQHKNNGITYYTFESFEQAGIKHAFFTRHGGVSPAPWSSLNFGALVGDAPENVAENYRRAFEALDCEPGSKYDVWQVHSADVAFADAPRPNTVPHKKADIILTDRPEVTVFMRFADCVPIMLYDPVKRIAGMVHAGWQGTVKQACAAAVQAMQDRYGTRPADILAGIGPSISAANYPVGQEVIDQFMLSFGEDAVSLMDVSGPQPKVNLQQANALSLQRCGVIAIEQAGLCTVDNVKDWYSHRAEKGATGRFGALIAL